jgi:hypothetical protein
MRNLLLLILIFVSINISKSQNIEFYREDLTFKLSETHFTVDGLYYFCNVSSEDITKTIFYPFPIDSLYGIIDSVFVENEEKLPVKFFQEKNKGIYFKMNIPPYGIKKLRINYRQEIYKNKAEYILTTTKYWNKPFEIVNYKLIVPKEIKISSLSYKPDSTFSTNKNKVYLWQKKDFMPTKNMIIYIE